MKDFVEGLTEEWNSSMSPVTIEFSLKEVDLDEFKRIISDVEVKNGVWVCFPCDTCVGQYGEGYLHAEIQRV